MKKRVLSFLLCLVMVFSLLPIDSIAYALDADAIGTEQTEVDEKTVIDEEAAEQQVSATASTNTSETFLAMSPVGAAMLMANEEPGDVAYPITVTVSGDGYHYTFTAVVAESVPAPADDGFSWFAMRKGENTWVPASDISGTNPWFRGMGLTMSEAAGDADDVIFRCSVTVDGIEYSSLGIDYNGNTYQYSVTPPTTDDTIPTAVQAIISSINNLPDTIETDDAFNSTTTAVGLIDAAIEALTYDNKAFFNSDDNTCTAAREKLAAVKETLAAYVPQAVREIISIVDGLDIPDPITAENAQDVLYILSNPYNKIEALSESDKSYFDAKCSETKTTLDAIRDECTSKFQPKIVTEINALAEDADEGIFTVDEAKAFYRRADEINNEYNALTDEEKAFISAYYPDALPTLNRIIEDCLAVIGSTGYKVVSNNPSSIVVKWNDNNNSAGFRPNSIDVTGLTLNYTIKDEHGTTVSSGVVDSETFKFLETSEYQITGDPLSYSAPAGSGDAYVDINDKLPTKYEMGTYDPSTGNQGKKTYTVDYSVSLGESFNVNEYVITNDGYSALPYTLAAGDTLILTSLLHWEGKVFWYDNSDAYETRPDTFNIWVYLGEQGSSDFSLLPDFSNYQLSTNGNTTTISLSGVPAYKNDGIKYIYNVKIGDDETSSHISIPDSSDYYYGTYTNVGNYASNMSAIYDGGYVIELLYGTVKFNVYKVWQDGLTAEQREDAGVQPHFHVWRVSAKFDDENKFVGIEFPSPVDPANPSYDVSKDSESGVAIETSFGSSLPKYNGDGVLNIYYGTETDFSPYSAAVDYTGTPYSEYNDIINYFSNLSGDGKVYFLNGSTVTNSNLESTSISVSKQFDAQALLQIIGTQGTSNLSASFILQKKVDGIWVNASGSDLFVPDESKGTITTTISGFSTVDTKIEMNKEDVPVLKKYDSNHNLIEYRWIETAITCGNETAELSPSGWSESAGSLSYNGTVFVNSVDGKSGPEDTTAAFTVSMSDGVAVNELVGEHRLEINKQFFDETGNISGNKDALDARKVKNITFTIYRDDIAYATVTMNYDGNNVDVSETGEDPHWHWESGSGYSYKLIETGETLTGDFPRYHDGGQEYRYTFEEGVSDWSIENNYHVSSVEKSENIWIKDTVSEFQNGGGGKVLYFDVNKLWKDESTIDSRNPVTFEIWRFQIPNPDGDGTVLLATPEMVYPTEGKTENKLNFGNNWFRHTRIGCYNNDSRDTVNNYIVLEKTMNPAGKVVDVAYNFEKSSASFSSLLEALSTDYFIGTVGSTSAEGANWDGLSYIYHAYESRHPKSSSYDVYDFTNIRTGSQIFYFTKTWKTGSEAAKCKFNLYEKNTLLAVIELDPMADGNDRLKVSWEIESYHGVPAGDQNFIQISLSESATGVNAEDLNQVSVVISNLAKFDENGSLVECTLQEIAMWDDSATEGTWKNFEGDVVQIGNTQITSSSKKEARDGNDAKEYHCSPDRYDYTFSNKIGRTIPMVANKVWRDGNAGFVRPDISYSLYRTSLKDAGLNTALNGEGGSLAGAAAYLKSNTGLWQMVLADKYWDTNKSNSVVHNNFWWSCNMDDMEMFDGNGYPYVYFIVEKSTSSQYKAYYCNMPASDAYPRNPSGDTIKTEDVFSITEGLQSANDAVLIISDGIHDPGYCSATVVNGPESTRTVSGEKLWKLPTGWIIPDTSFPGVTVSLYRSTTLYNTGAEYEGSSYVDEIKKCECVADKMLNYDPNKDGIYTYEFETEDVSGNELPEFDKYGYVYYYYTLETAIGASDETAIASRFEPKYYDNDFNISNIYKNDPPSAEIKVQKTWKVNSELIGENGEFIFAEDAQRELFYESLAPVVFKLTGQATENGLPTGNEFEFSSVTLEPKPEGTYNANAGFGDDDVITVTHEKASDTLTAITARYTFKYYMNDVSGIPTKTNLPYYAPNGTSNTDTIIYKVSENRKDGYSAETHDDAIVLDQFDEENNVYSNNTAEPAAFINTYTGISNNFSIGFSKVWDDKYVDNTEYRPDAVVYLIKRYPSGSSYDAYNSGIGSTDQFNARDVKVIIPKEANKYTWSVSGLNSYYNAGTAESPDYRLGKNQKINLLKYAPDGNTYTYFIYSESFATDNNGSLEFGTQTASAVNEQIGHYVLKSKSNTSCTNTFKENEYTHIKIIKRWKANGEEISYTEFKNLLNMGCLPVSVQYIIERSADNGSSWSRVNASEYPQLYDGTFKVTVDGVSVLGHEVNLSGLNEYTYSNYLNFNFEWDKLPLQTNDMSSNYSYRASERFIWADGSTTDVDDSTVVKDINVSIDNKFADSEKRTVFFTNNISTTRAKFIKVWDDTSGYDNCRPSKIELTIIPVVEGEGAYLPSGITYELASKGHNLGNNVYVANEDFSIGSVTCGSADQKYIIIEKMFDAYTDYDVILTNDSSVKFTQTGIGDEKQTAAKDKKYTYIEYTSEPISASKVFTHLSDGLYQINITNKTTETYKRKTIDITAKKVWAGVYEEAYAKAGLTRPDIYFKLQYIDGSGIPQDFTVANIGNFSPTLTMSDVVRKLEYGSDGKPIAVVWKDLYKYITANTVDGVAILQRYRIVEGILDGQGNFKAFSELSNLPYTVKPTNGVSTNLNNVNVNNVYSGTSATFTNTLKTFEMKFFKAWPKTDSTLFSQNELSELIALNAVPEKITFEIECKINGDWEPVPGFDNYKHYCTDVSIINLLNGVSISNFFAYYDKAGIPVEYRIKETSIKYKNSTSKNVTWNGKTGTVDNFTTSYAYFDCNYTRKSLELTEFKNSYDYTSLTVYKTWKDEDNRDGKRADVKFTLFRDGDPYAELDSATGKITQTDNTNLGVIEKEFNSDKNIWVFTWKYLPKYKDDHTTESVYTWAETTGVSGYTSDPGIYNPDDDNRNPSDVTAESNIYVPIRQNITATKSWGDSEEELRPETIKFKLQYLDPADNNWKDVTHKNLDEFNLYPDGYAAYTTSTELGEDNWVTVQVSSGTFTWKDLPAYIRNRNTGAKCTASYKVLEEKVTGYKDPQYSKTSVTINSGEDAEVTVTNNATDYTVTKTWNDSNNLYDSRPAKIKVQLQKADGTPISDVELTPEDWTYTWNLPVGEYKVVETALIYVVDETEVEVPAADSNYIVSYAPLTEGEGENESIIGTAITNTLPETSVKADKTFADEKDRDGFRTQTVTFKLYKNGTAEDNLIDTQVVDVAADGTAEYEWKNLPKYVNGSSNPAKYYIVEEINSSEYIVSYTYENGNDVNLVTQNNQQVDVTNTHTPYSFNIEASKTWNDNDNKYGLRPDDISLTLKWSTDPDDPSSWKDVVKGHTAGDNSDVHTSSDPTQVLSKDDIPDNNNRSKWGYAIWNDLPAYVVVEENNVATSKLVYYRVVESGLPTSYTGEDSTTISFEDAELTQNTNSTTPQILVAHTSITNTLEGLTRLEVIKSFEDIADEDGYNVIPESVTVKLQYSKDNGVTWNDVAREGTAVLNKGNEWKYEWLGLRNDYEYRAAEVSIKYGDKTVAVSGDEISGTVGIFSYSAVTQKNSDNTKTTTKISNTLPETSLSVTKIWQDDSNLEGERPDSITYKLYRDPTGENGQPSEDDTPFDIVTVSGDATTNNGWGYKWEKLPVYNNEGTAVSKYTVVEVPLAKELNYETTYNGCENITLDTTASYNGATVTNTRIYLDVEKKFENSTIYPIQIPVYITVQLQERDSVGYWRPVEGGSYDINAATGWKHRFTNLDASKEYRAVEVSLFYSDLGEIKVNDANTTSEDLNNRKAGNLYRCDSATEKEGAHFISTLTNTYIWHPIVPPPQPVPYIPGGKTAVTVTDTELEDPEVPKAKMPITGAESGDISLLPVVGGGLLGLAGIGGTLGALKKGRKKKENEESEVDESNNET